jgi:uncharacterized damage-inducible protein DinB
MKRTASPTDPDRWKQQAIRRMTRTRAATLKFLARVPKAEVVKAGTQGQWSIKDVLAHIAAWEQEGAKRLQLIRRGQSDKIVFYDDLQGAHGFNARAVARARRLSLSSLMDRLEAVRERLIDELTRLPSTSLNDPTHRYPVIAWLPEFAWTHEQDHLRRLRQWWTKRL